MNDTVPSASEVTAKDELTISSRMVISAGTFLISNCLMAIGDVGIALRLAGTIGSGLLGVLLVVIGLRLRRAKRR